MYLKAKMALNIKNKIVFFQDHKNKRIPVNIAIISDIELFFERERILNVQTKHEKRDMCHV